MVDMSPLVPESSEEVAQPTVFAAGVKWQKMDPTNEVNDPMYGAEVRAPTVPVGERTHAIKRDFVQIFDRPVFASQMNTYVYDRFKRRKVDRKSGNFVKETKTRKKGCPNPEFIEKNQLNVDSRPTEWFEAFVPQYMYERWKSYTNTKAMIANAGKKGSLYPDFKDSETEALKRHIGYIILHGISPSPQVNM